MENKQVGPTTGQKRTPSQGIRSSITGTIIGLKEAKSGNGFIFNISQNIAKQDGSSFTRRIYTFYIPKALDVKAAERIDKSALKEGNRVNLFVSYSFDQAQHNDGTGNYVPTVGSDNEPAIRDSIHSVISMRNAKADEKDGQTDTVTGIAMNVQENESGKTFDLMITWNHRNTAPDIRNFKGIFVSKNNPIYAEIANSKMVTIQGTRSDKVRVDASGKEILTADGKKIYDPNWFTTYEQKEQVAQPAAQTSAQGSEDSTPNINWD